MRIGRKLDGSRPRARLLPILVLVLTLCVIPTSQLHSQEHFPPGRIAFIRKGDVWVWSNGESERLIKDGRASDPRWSPTGRFMIFVRSGESYSDLILYDLEHGTEQQLTSNQPGLQIGSPDYVANTSWVLDPDWSSAGLIAFASDATGDNSVILWLLPSPDLSAYPAPAARSEDDLEAISLDAAGAIAAYTVRLRTERGVDRTAVSLRDLNTGAITMLVDEPNGAFDPAIAPDGESIAVAIRDASGMTDIWLSDRTGSLSRVTVDAHASQPAWSPDGTWLAYMRMVDYRFEVWAVLRDGDGFGEPRRLFRFKNLDPTSRISWTLSATTST